MTFWKKVRVFFVALLIGLQPVFAWAADDPETPPEWVLPYFLVLLFVGLSIVILLRSPKRADSAFTQEELDKIKEEELKKMVSSH